MAIIIPTSKSYTQRALVVASLANGESVIVNPLICDDSRVLIAALTEFGVMFTWNESRLHVLPPKKFKIPSVQIDIENAGTAARFISAFSLLIDGSFCVNGSERMQSRPMQGLLATLIRMGVQVNCQNKPFSPPVEFTYSRALQKSIDRVQLDPTESSQQLTSLMLIAPRLENGLHIELTGMLPSKPYVDMTVDVMRAFGVSVELNESSYFISNGTYNACQYEIEGDWSSASYVYGGNFLTGKNETISNVNLNSIQGDRVVVDILDKFKSNDPLILNLNDAPDIVPTLVACALFRHAPTTLTHIGHLRLKECDRIHVLTEELKKIGGLIQESETHMHIPAWNGNSYTGASLNPHHDHRMAMAFGLIKLRVPNITIQDKACVSKSYPNFWEMLESFTT